MRFLSVTAVAVLAGACFSKPDFEGRRDSGPDDARRDAELDGPPLPACAWRDFEGPKTYLPLDEMVGEIAVVDGSGSMRNGTASGATLGATGKILGAASFADGTDARIQLDSIDAFDNLAALTACSWVWLDRLPVAGTELASNIVDKSLNGFTGGWNLYVEVAQGNRIGFLSSWGHFVAGQATVTQMTWMHVCASWDGSEGPAGIRLYRDGVADQVQITNSLGRSSRDPDDPHPLTLGRGMVGNQYNLFGKLDEFFLYDRVLTPQEITSIYQCAQ